uniref:Glabrous enhancer-binding protein-like DBD domain-containing protein n=1 Tax=Leersia perrieri TaxID=77586 RepID=A0A0D9X8R3_9ORYZ
MAPKRPDAASGSASEASDGEAPRRRSRSRSRSPSRSVSLSPSRSRSKTPPSNLHPNPAALSTPASAAVDFAAVSDSDADAAAADADADADARLASPRRSRERSPRLHSDSDNSAAAEVEEADAEAVAVAAASDDGDDEGNATPPPRSRRSSRVEPSSIKPISSRPMDASRRPATPAAAGGSSQSQRRSKRPRASPAQHSPEYQKRQPRVWNPEDEVTILRALITYRAKNGVLPGSSQETAKLHNMIRGQLTVKASTTQLSDKIRRLKHKFNLILARVTKSGREPNFPTVHDREVYDLSKKVWNSKTGGVISAGAGSAGGGGGGRVYENVEEVAESDEEQGSAESDDDMESGWDDRDHRNKRLKAIVANGNGNAIVTGGRSVHGNGSWKGDAAEKGKDMYPYLWEAVEELSKEHPSGTTFRKAFGMLDGSRARAMEEKLNRFRLSEIRQQVRRMDLMKETIKMVLDALEGTIE